MQANPVSDIVSDIHLLLVSAGSYPELSLSSESVCGIDVLLCSRGIDRFTRTLERSYT